MLFVLIYWLFLFLLFYVYGFQLINIIIHPRSQNQCGSETYFFTGFIIFTCLTFYASLFFPLNHCGLLLISFIGVSIGILNRKALKLKYKNLLASIASLTKLERGIVLALFLYLGLIASSKEPMVFDTWLYHAQNVQWIRKFSVVPGLGNLQPQFGFNNMFFVVSALFTIDYSSETFELLVYPLNGLILLVFFYSLLFHVKEEYQKSNSERAFLYALIFGIGLVIFPNWASSPSADLVCAVLSMYVLLYWEKSRHEVSKLDSSYLLLSLIIICIVFKLSTLFLGLLGVILLFYGFSLKKIAKSVVLGIILVLPFFIRNFYLSGYLVFPFPYIDIFDVDWKITYRAANFEKLVIWSWARIPKMNPTKVAAMSFGEWFEVWWSAKDLIWKPLLLVNCLSIVSLFFLWLKKEWNWLVIQGILIINLTFWFYNAPDVRFAFGFLILNATLVIYSFSLLFELYFNTKLLVIGVLGIFTVFSVYYHRLYLQNFIQEPTTVLLPKGLPKGETTTFYTNFSFSKPNRGSHCYNLPLPCVTRPLGRVTARDSMNLAKGFRIEEK